MCKEQHFSFASCFMFSTTNEPSMNDFSGIAYLQPIQNGPGRKKGLDRPSVYTGLFWNWSRTDPKLDMLFCRSSIGSVPDPKVPDGPM